MWVLHQFGLVFEVDMSKLQGRAKKYDGTPIDYVSIFNWGDGKCIAQVAPDATGNWEYEYYGNHTVGITYIADGCEPITHGSYTIEGEWAPKLLFNAGEIGVWFDPSDLSTLYQDGNGTIPVTADGQSVALMKDKSGNNYHATQSIASKRPIYRTNGTLHWLDFDGISQFMTVENSAWFNDMNALTFQVSANISSESQPYSAVVGKLEKSLYKGFVVQPTDKNSTRVFGLGGASGVQYDNKVEYPMLIDTPAVLTASWLAGDYFYARKNTDAPVSSNGVGRAGALNAGTEPLVLGRLSYIDTLLCKCKIYGVVIVNKNKPTELQNLIDYSSQKAGLTV